MSTVRAYLQLLRFPAVFTAVSDIVLGYVLNHRSLEEGWPKFVLLFISSASLYLAGMVLNDVFDRGVDAVERPRRPLPSGRVSVRAAVVLSGLLLLTGVGSAAAAGLQSLAIAGGIVAAIFLYNGFLKKTVLGPIGMGLCRFLNVMLGASGHTLALAVWSRYQWQLAAAMGVYIVGVTWFARNEASNSRPISLMGALAVINLGIGGMIAYVANFHAGMKTVNSVMISLAVMAMIVNRRLLTTLFQPTPERVQMSVRMLLYSYLIFEATLIYSKTQDPRIAIATAAMIIPATLIGRWISIT